ncbi:MAG TPA: hypothetical protein DIT90_04405 [Dehalococcoidia bacterium]|nr:hypothetical protein [Dehalococcoidia bacterium]|tara:strand:- start:4888 stop:5286 length:399 start_codon:yes stop_codon:yes gene_type:complete
MLKYYYSSKIEPSGSDVNDGIGEVGDLLSQLAKHGVPVDRIDVADLSERERADAYLDAVAVSVLKKYRIRQVFGSRRLSGTSFGKQVPALIVRYLVSESPEQVYPHQKSEEYVPIATFLRAYLDQIQAKKVA